MSEKFEAMIRGVRMSFEEDENGFWNGTVEPSVVGGKRLETEWLIRQAINKEQAIELAYAALEHRLAGRSILHDPEGRMHAIDLNTTLDAAGVKVKGSEFGTNEAVEQFLKGFDERQQTKFEQICEETRKLGKAAAVRGQFGTDFVGGIPIEYVLVSFRDRTNQSLQKRGFMIPAPAGMQNKPALLVDIWLAAFMQAQER
jgi:hypothetical protein